MSTDPAPSAEAAAVRAAMTQLARLWEASADNLELAINDGASRHPSEVETLRGCAYELRSTLRARRPGAQSASAGPVPDVDPLGHGPHPREWQHVASGLERVLAVWTDEPQLGDELAGVLREVRAERARQARKHGDQSHFPDGTAPDVILTDLPVYQNASARAGDLAEWAKARTQAASQDEGGEGSVTFEHILTQEWAEAIAECDPAKLRAELIQVAAVAVQWVEAIDGRRR